MKIVHYLASTNQKYGGPIRAVTDLCRLLAAGGHQVTLITPDATDAPKDWNAPGMPTLAVVEPPRLPGGLYTRGQRGRLAELLRGADALHLHGIWERASLQLGRIARDLGVPYFISTRGMLDDYCFDHRGLKKRVYMRLFAASWLKHARRIHCTADEELRQSQRFFPQGHGVIIPNLMDMAPFERLPGPEIARQKFPFLPSPRPSVLFLGRLHPIKGLERLLDAARVLVDRGQPFEIVLAGPPESEAYQRTLEGQAERLGLTGQTHFVGMVSGEAKLSLLQACDLFVQPSHHENFGMSLVEALACGTPLITTRGVKIWPELERSGGAIIADPEPEPFADAIASVLFDRQKLRAMGEAGRRWVFDFLDPAKVRARFEAMYAAA